MQRVTTNAKQETSRHCHKSMAHPDITAVWISKASGSWCNYAGHDWKRIRERSPKVRIGFVSTTWNAAGLSKEMAEGGTEDTHNMIALTARLQELTAPGQGKEPSDEAHISPEDTAVLDTAQKRVEQ